MTISRIHENSTKLIQNFKSATTVGLNMFAAKSYKSICQVDDFTTLCFVDYVNQFRSSTSVQFSTCTKKAVTPEKKKVTSLQSPATAGRGPARTAAALGRGLHARKAVATRVLSLVFCHIEAVRS